MQQIQFQKKLRQMGGIYFLKIQFIYLQPVSFKLHTKCSYIFFLNLLKKYIFIFQEYYAYTECLTTRPRNQQEV